MCSAWHGTTHASSTTGWLRVGAGGNTPKQQQGLQQALVAYGMLLAIPQVLLVLPCNSSSARHGLCGVSGCGKCCAQLLLPASMLQLDMAVTIVAVRSVWLSARCCVPYRGVPWDRPALLDLAGAGLSPAVVPCKGCCQDRGPHNPTAARPVASRLPLLFGLSYCCMRGSSWWTAVHVVVVLSGAGYPGAADQVVNHW